MNSPQFFALVVFPGLFLAGCVATTTDVDRLQDSLNSVQKGQADLIVKMDQLDRSLISLNERLDDNQKKMAALTKKLEDTQTHLGGRMELISTLLSAATTQASVPVPSEQFKTAYGDYVSGKTDIAVMEFKSFIARYPDSDLADDARYYLADCYLARKDFSQARMEIDKYLAQSSDLRAGALLKRSYALAGMQKPKDQESTLQTLLKEFPDSAEARTARQILDELKEASAPKKTPPKKKAADE